jgi:hypothetical protein
MIGAFAGNFGLFRRAGNGTAHDPAAGFGEARHQPV